MEVEIDEEKVAEADDSTPTTEVNMQYRNGTPRRIDAAAPTPRSMSAPFTDQPGLARPPASMSAPLNDQPGLARAPASMSEPLTDQAGLARAPASMPAPRNDRPGLTNPSSLMTCLPGQHCLSPPQANHLASPSTYYNPILFATPTQSLQATYVSC